MIWRTNPKIWLAVSILLLAVAGTAAGQIIYVDADAGGADNGTSWPNAYSFLQDALTEAGSLGTAVEVRVAQGIYEPDANSALPNGSGDRAATFQLIDGVILKGGYAGFGQPDPDARDVTTYETILSGDLDGNDVEVDDPCDLPNEPTRAENSYHVVTGSGTDETAVLDGFTITAGNANGNCPSCDGGGMYNKYGGSPTVVNCTFLRNSARVRGGAMHIAMYSDPVLINCAFIANSSESGGAVYNSGGTEQNTCEPMLLNCVFSGNSAAARAGGMDNHGRSTLIGCTFSGNSAKSGVGGMFDFFGRATLTNCILWGNTGDATGESAQIHAYDPYIGETDINYCCIQGWTGGWGGTGNTGSDPCFVQPGCSDASGTWVEGDYHLLPASRCIDAGDNNSVPADTTDLDGDGNTAEQIPWDLDGNPRIVDGNSDGNQIVDMGAYEFFVPPLEAQMKFTPQALNPASQGNWVKAHLVLPEGFTVGDVDTSKPAKIIEPFELECDNMNVFLNEDGLVEVEAAFDRGRFCGNSPVEGNVLVVGCLTRGRYFCGTDTIRIINHSFKCLAGFASYWLEGHCSKPDWCGGLDLNQDSEVNLVDFALFDGCCIEIISD